MRATRKKVILYRAYTIMFHSFQNDPIVRGFTCPPSSGLDFSSLCRATGYYRLKASSRCNDLSSTLVDRLVCIYRSRNILGGRAKWVWFEGDVEAVFLD